MTRILLAVLAIVTVLHLADRRQASADTAYQSYEACILAETGHVPSDIYQLTQTIPTCNQ